MHRFLALACLFVLGCQSVNVVVRPGGRRDPKADAHDIEAYIILNGERTKVLWSDGDSFDFKAGPYEGQGTRMVGYNTLEAYGPVHRWGSWSREELFDIAKKGSHLAASKEWTCTTSGDQDAYNRVLVDCPDLAREMAMSGIGLAYAVSGRPPRLVLDAMHQAQRAGRGMWEKGVPSSVITSLHSRGEPGGEKYSSAANRVLETRTGEARLRKHNDHYVECEEVCIEDSCMVYVPYDHRYHDQPPCLIGAP